MVGTLCHHFSLDSKGVTRIGVEDRIRGFKVDLPSSSPPNLELTLVGCAVV